MRVFLRVAYDGTNFHGWQFQEGQKTIQGEIEKALCTLLKKPTTITGASRTDAGVHALSNIAVFDTDSTIPGDRFLFALNDILPEDIKIVESKYVSEDFNPRYNVVDKTYEYRIYNGQVAIPTKRLYSYHYRGKLDDVAMNKAAEYLVGTHDFTSFSSVHAQVRTFVRTIFFCKVTREDDEVIISVNGNGFLYNMVRIIAGTLLEVGCAKRNPKEIKEILDKRDRIFAGQTLPPQGLILKDIHYENA